jgi:uncharacterized protein
MSTALTDRRELGVAEGAATLDWQQIVNDLDSYGCAVAKGALTPEECHELSSCYESQIMKIDVRYPATHAAFLEQCHRAGQVRPTPLLLQYDEGDFNCLHQDVYGDLVFPLQVAFLLSVPGEDFTGGEFVLVEQRPRMQSRAEVVQLGQGDGVIFAVHHRPVQGTRGTYRVNLRHGVSRLRSGRQAHHGSYFS